MRASWYNVEVKISAVDSRDDYVECIQFKSLENAKFMAKRYYDCVDVQSVDVIDQMTGEVVYFHNPKKEYDAKR